MGLDAPKRSTLSSALPCFSINTCASATLSAAPDLDTKLEKAVFSRLVNAE